MIPPASLMWFRETYLPRSDFLARRLTWPRGELGRYPEQAFCSLDQRTPYPWIFIDILDNDAWLHYRKSLATKCQQKKKILLVENKAKLEPRKMSRWLPPPESSNEKDAKVAPMAPRLKYVMIDCLTHFSLRTMAATCLHIPSSLARTVVMLGVALHNS